MHHFMLLHEKQFIIFTSVRKHFSPSLWEDCWLRSSRNDKTSQLGGGTFFDLDTKWNISLPSSRHSRILLHNSTRYATYRCFRFNVRQTFLESCDKKWEKRKQLNTSESLLRFDLRTSCIRSFVSREPLCRWHNELPLENEMSRIKSCRIALTLSGCRNLNERDCRATQELFKWKIYFTNDCAVG